MKFFLAKDEPFIFSCDFSFHGSNRGKFGKFTMRYQVNECDLDEFDTRISDVLKGMVDHYPCSKHKSSSEMTLLLFLEEPESMCQGILALGQEKENYLKDIGTLIGEDNIRVIVTLSFSPMPISNGVINTGNQTEIAHNYVSTEAMVLRLSGSVLSCRDTKVKFQNSETCERFLVSGTRIKASLSVEVTVNTTLIRPRVNSSKENLLEKMLRDEIHSDFTITAENGSMVKCHKSVLSACSPVFEAMIATDMEESRTCNVNLPEMSEQVVKSFLSYIYSKNEDEPSKNCEIAFDLLNAAHKYDVTPDLEKAMTILILSKPVEWFTVDVGVKIFLLARNIPNNGDELKEKAVQILKENFAILPGSETYVKLFQENSTGAMELCQLAFGSLSSK